jgi:hypothetical protein
MTVPLDPFAHLHDESFADAYETPRADHHGLIAMGGRVRISLNGAWHFTRDLFDEGLRQTLFADPPTPPAEWRKPRDFDEWAAEEIAVAGCWNLHHDRRGRGDAGVRSALRRGGMRCAFLRYSNIGRRRIRRLL